MRLAQAVQSLAQISLSLFFFLVKKNESKGSINITNEDYQYYDGNIRQYYIVAVKDSKMLVVESVLWWR